MRLINGFARLIVVAVGASCVAIFTIVVSFGSRSIELVQSDFGRQDICGVWVEYTWTLQYSTIVMVTVQRHQDTASKTAIGQRSTDMKGKHHSKTSHWSTKSGTDIGHNITVRPVIGPLKVVQT